MHSTTGLLRDLVAIPSVNPMGRDLPEAICFEHRVTAYLEELFRDLRVSFEKQTIAPGRENIIARTDHRPGRKTVVFEAHQDTVPVDGMIVEPFGARVEGGRLYGRGACDIKGGMAAMLAAFVRIVKEKPAHALNVVMACTADEEHTFLGVQKLAQEGLQADFAIVAEPTKLGIVNAHKGVVRWTLATEGRACHSSDPTQGVNAIYRMGKLLVGAQAYADHLPGTVSDPLLGPPTISVGRIEGGTSVNTVPDRCRIEVDRRLIPGELEPIARQDFIEFLHHQRLGFEFTCSEPWLNCPALGPELSGDLVKRLAHAIDEVRGKHKVFAVPYGTDASTLAKSGIPAVVFGPNDIAQAHTKDEWADLEEVEMASEILYRLACRE